MVVLYELKVHHFLGYFLFIQTPPPKHKNDNMTVSVNIITTLHSYIFNGFWFIMSDSSASTFIFFSLLSRLFVCFFSLPSPPVFVCWRHWSADTLFDSCHSTITWMSQIRMSTIQLDTDCICLGHLAAILIANH